MARQRVRAKKDRRHHDNLHFAACMSSGGEPLQIGIELALPISISIDGDGKPLSDSPTPPTWRDAGEETVGRTVIEIDLA